MRGRIGNLETVLNEDNRQLELAEQRIAEARSGGKEEGEIKILEENAGHKRRERDENKTKLDNLREELRRTYQ